MKGNGWVVESGSHSQMCAVMNTWWYVLKLIIENSVRDNKVDLEKLGL